MSTENNTRPIVSAILPTRNRAQLLGRAIDSILAQEGRGTQFDVEATVVDDASSDKTSEVVGRYTGVRYIRLETQHGAGAARNVGIKSSTGKYVAFQDDDDVWLPGKLRLQTAALERNPGVGVVYSQTRVINPQGETFLWPEASSAPSGFVFEALLLDNFCAHPPMLLIRRDVFAKSGYFDEDLVTKEDYDLCLRIAFHFPFLFVPGTVAVRHESPHGLYFSSVARGSAEKDGRRVIRRALDMLPVDRRHDALRREVSLRSELANVQHRMWFAPVEERWPAILAVVRTNPEILRYRGVRATIASEAFSLMFDTTNPIGTGRQITAELWEAAPPRTLAGWLWRRLTMAAVWSHVAALCGPSKARIAAAASLRALIYDPTKVRKKAVWSSLFAGLLRHS